MMTLDELLNEICTTKSKLVHLRDSLVLPQVRREYYRVAELWPWITLRKEMTHTIDGDALEMPRNLSCKMIFVKSTDGQIFFPRDVARRGEYGAQTYVWYISGVSSDADASGTNVVATHGSTTLTLSAAPGDTLTGHIQIGNSSALYEISSISGVTVTLAKPWADKPINAGEEIPWVINPAGQVSINFEDPEGTAVTSGDLSIWYSIYPKQLLSDSDVILVPPDVLKYKVLSVVANGAQTRRDNLTMYDEALIRATAEHPGPFTGPAVNRNRTGSIFTFDDPLYESRENYNGRHTFSRTN